MKIFIFKKKKILVLVILPKTEDGDQGKGNVMGPNPAWKLKVQNGEDIA